MSQGRGTTYIMNNEHTFALVRETTGTNTATGPASDQSVNDAVERIRVALAELNQVRIGPMSRPEAHRTLGLLSQAQSVVTSLMCDVGRQVADTEPDSDPAEVLRQGARLPSRESKRMAKVARQLSEMPKVRERFSTGDITPTHVNALANAAEKIGPDAVETDEGLLEAADQMSPDSFNRHARKWSDRKLIEAGLDPLERQRRAREAKLWVEKETGLGVLMAKVPRPQFEHFRQAIDSHYMRLVRQDGTDSPDPDQVRTPTQRLADVVFELVTNRNAVTGEFVTENVGIRAKASTQLILVASVGVLDGTDPGGQIEMIGVGPVPRHILATLSLDTELAGMIFNRAGRPLWLGRNQRLGNAAQRLAVAVRDGGCFECGAPMHRCELHHIREWRRDRGRTDIHNLVAVCRRHHRWLETNNLVVRRSSNGYQTRPRAGPSPPG